jgi:hypothetical protein
MITGQAFTAYWDSVSDAFANATTRDEPVEPRELTDVFPPDGPIFFKGDLRYWFGNKTIQGIGEMTTDGMTVVSEVLMQYHTIGKSQFRIDTSERGMGLFVVRLDGVDPITMTPNEFEPVTINVTCNAKTLTWTIPLKGTTPVQIVLVRPSD